MVIGMKWFWSIALDDAYTGYTVYEPTMLILFTFGFSEHIIVDTFRYQILNVKNNLKKCDLLYVNSYQSNISLK